MLYHATSPISVDGTEGRSEGSAPQAPAAGSKPTPQPNPRFGVFQASFHLLFIGCMKYGPLRSPRRCRDQRPRDTGRTIEEAAGNTGAGLDFKKRKSQTGRGQSLPSASENAIFPDTKFGISTRPVNTRKYLYSTRRAADFNNKPLSAVGRGEETSGKNAGSGASTRHRKRKRPRIQIRIRERSPVPGLTVRKVEMRTQAQRIVVDNRNPRGQVLALDYNDRRHRDRRLGLQRSHRSVIRFPGGHVRQRIRKRKTRSRMTDRIRFELDRPFRKLGRGGQSYEKRATTARKIDLFILFLFISSYL